MPKRPKWGLWEHHPHLCLPLARRLLAEREGRQPAAPAPAQAPESAPPGQVGEETMQPDANRPDVDATAASTIAARLQRLVEDRAKQHKSNKDEGIPSRRRGLGKARRAALAKRKKAAEKAAGSPAKGAQKPPPTTHIGRLFSLLPCRQGFEAVHITGTLTTLGALLRRHEKFDRGGVKKLTGVQLPTEKEWRMHTEVEGSKLTAKKRRAVEACLHCKREEYEVEVDEDGKLKKGKKAARTGKTGGKKTDWFVHIGLRGSWRGRLSPVALREETPGQRQAERRQASTALRFL
ncbi:hypothetical protein APUTEX25_005842, partial [Auxenochlorella protothecoides]